MAEKKGEAAPHDATISEPPTQRFSPVDPAALEEFKKAMEQDVIPEIIKVVEERRLLAAESRERQLTIIRRSD